MSSLAICLNTRMGIQDNWKANLAALVRQEGGGNKRRGYQLVAQKTGLSEEYIYQLAENKPRPDGGDRLMGHNAAKKIALAYADGRPENWFDTEMHPMVRRVVTDDYALKQYDTGGAMGSGLTLKDQPGVIRSFNVSREWIEKNLPYYTNIDNLAIVTGFGDSMLGLFNPGDPLIVDRGITKADVDGVYFFRVGDEGFIKRLQRIPGEGLLVISENSKYRDWTIKQDMDFAVLAKVLRAWKGQIL